LLVFAFDKPFADRRAAQPALAKVQLRMGSGERPRQSCLLMGRLLILPDFSRL